MPAERYLIVNADDFGQSPGVNHGIIEAHEHGIVTSASLMVRWPAAVRAAAYGRDHPEFGVGLHVDLAEWTCRDGSWSPRYQVVSPDDPTAIAREANAQLQKFRELMGQDPTHVDSHQHIHREAPAHSVIASIARELGVPLRHFSPRVQYCGSFYGQTPKGIPCPEALSVESLIQILQALLPGITELACHPALDNDLESMYASERPIEVQTLGDPRVKEALAREGIRLCSFRDVLRA
jgi:chitin disaccharide deacetylase